jgi:hypothetical protein
MSGKVKTFFRTERVKLREMNFKEKRQYIWEYYKLHIFAFVLLSFLFGSLINIWFINPPKQDYLYIAWLTPGVPDEALRNAGGALSVIVENPEREQVQIISYATTNNPQLDMALQQRFIAMLQIGSMDMFLTPRAGITELADNGLSRSVHEVMGYIVESNPAIYREISERIITITYNIDEYTQHTDDMGISLAGAPFFDYVGIDSRELYFSVVINTQNFYRIAKALEAFFVWTP